MNSILRNLSTYLCSKMHFIHPNSFKISYLLTILLLSTMLIGCLGPTQTATPTLPYVIPPTPTPLPEAMVTFRVSIPNILSPGEAIYLTLQDEVTGLAINPTRYQMTAEDSQHYSVILPFTMGSVLKYRYTRQGAIAVEEHISDGRAVRYRLYHVTGPGVVQDVVSRWTDTTFTGPTGRINGSITDAKTGQPIPNMLVSAGGAQALTTTDGNYLLEGLPPGTHNLVAYALDGSYRTFQQGAIVASDSTTPAPIQLSPAALVNISFTLITPRGNIPALPIRMAGNLWQLGNTFADLSAGINTIAIRMPYLAPLPDGRWRITLTLPAGADLRYKYTLGDGFWNAEHGSNGSFRLRQLIVPEKDTNVDDVVDTWQSGQSAPISFDVTVPTNTPEGESVSIQFSTGYSWTEPIPMWPIAKNRWGYILVSPLDKVNNFGYRYCREDQCGYADDASTMVDKSRGHPVSTSLLPQTLVDDVIDWAWWPSAPAPATVPNVAVQPHGNNFMAGIEFQAYYHPSWQPLMIKALNDIKSQNANWVILTPTWTYTRISPPVLEILPGNDPLYPDVASTISQARNLGFNVALFPTPRFPKEMNQWWQEAPRDFSWWVSWFENYRNFAIDHADMATKNGAQALILGGDWVTPVLPGGTLSDQSSSNVPADAEARWRSLIQEVRSHFNGVLLWALPYPQSGKTPPPAFLDVVDQVYLLWTAPLASKPGATETELTTEASRILESTISPLQKQTNKPLVLAVAFPSAENGVTGCLPAPQGGCLGMNALIQPDLDNPNINLNIQEQTDAYNAMLTAINELSWISGFVSRGYYPPVPLQDKSISIHGKPASGTLWYWFPRLLGKQE